MKILLISESSTEDDIYRMIDQIIKIDKIIETHDISEELSYITDIRYDIIIINYDKVRIRHGDFKMIYVVAVTSFLPTHLCLLVFQCNHLLSYSVHAVYLVFHILPE